MERNNPRLSPSGTARFFPCPYGLWPLILELNVDVVLRDEDNDGKLSDVSAGNCQKPSSAEAASAADFSTGSLWLAWTTPSVATASGGFSCKFRPSSPAAAATTAGAAWGAR